MRRILPSSEIRRNKRIAEIMKQKTTPLVSENNHKTTLLDSDKKQPNSLPIKMTIQQMEKVKELMKDGLKRDEAVKIVFDEN